MKISARTQHRDTAGAGSRGRTLSRQGGARLSRRHCSVCEGACRRGHGPPLAATFLGKTAVPYQKRKKKQEKTIVGFFLLPIHNF